MYATIFIFTFVTSALICHFIAQKRGANPVFWGVMGGVLGPFVIPFVFLSKRGAPVNHTGNTHDESKNHFHR